MAGYFSNHSQSRFLANSSNTTQHSSSTTTSTMTTTSHSHVPISRRISASKHFSTSVSTSSSGDEKPSGKERLGHAMSNGSGAVTVHPLRNTCVCNAKLYNISYRRCLTKIDGCSGSANNARRGTKLQTMKKGLRRSPHSAL